jgi:hypothetical protein
MTTTTIPAPPSATVSAPQTQTCNTPLDYAVVRKNNIAQITEHYQKLLDTYTKAYTDYSTNNASSKQPDRDYAKLTLKPKTEAYNTQIINISRELMSSVNKDTDLIVEQTKELEKNVQKLNILMDDIKLLRERNAEFKIAEQSQEDNVKLTQSGSDDLHFTSQIYMGINMLLVLIIVGLIIYLVYSNFTSKKNNTNSTTTSGNTSTNAMNKINGINNIYKNIKVNTQ